MIDDFEEIEQDLLDRLHNLSARLSRQDSAVLRTGFYRNRPVWIHTTKRNRTAFQFTPDSLCHYITIHSLYCSHRMSQIWILPQLVATNQFLLSHLWVPFQKKLVLYMCPLSYYGTVQLTGDNRYDTANPAAGGLLHSVFTQIESGLDEHKIHKFLIPVDSISATDLQLMENLSES